MFRLGFLKSLVVITFVTVIVFPIYTNLFIYPSFTKFIISNTEREAKQVAMHFYGMVFSPNAPYHNTSHKGNITKNSIPADVSDHVIGLIADFDIMKIKVFSPSGEVVYSTDSKEIGDINTRDYFHQNIAKGESFSKLVRKNSSTLEDETMAVDVVETYVPLMEGENFIGAVEVYYDISGASNGLSSLVDHINYIIFIIGAILLTSLVFSTLMARRNIIDRLQIEDDLRGERDFIEAILNTVGVIIMVLDSEGRIVRFNSTCEEIMGYTFGEVQGKYAWDVFIIPEEVVAVKQVFAELKAGKFPNKYENYVLTKDGELRLISWANTALTDKDGNVEYVIPTGTDITERKELQNKIIRAKEEWEEIFDSINDAITIHDKDFNILRLNKAATKMLGADFLTVLNQKCFVSYHGLDGPPEGCPSRQTQETGELVTTEIYEPHLGKHLEIRAIPRKDNENNIIGLVHIVRDIESRFKAEEEQKKLQEQLLQSQKMEAVGQLAGGVAHDFNNLLTGIIGFSSLALEQVDKDSDIAQDMTEVVELANRASTLTRQLLAFSRRQTIEPEEVYINELIIQFSKMLKRLLGEDVDFKFEPSEDVMEIEADPGQIEQILMNMVVNSRQAMPGGGKLIIKTENSYIDESESEIRQFEVLPGPYVKIVVSDTGIGMDQNTKEQIFEPFFSTKAKGGNSGLGLSTVYGIIKQHKGYVFVESEPDQGATFEIYFPALSEEKIAPKIVEVEEAPQKKNILVVEDDNAVVRVIDRMLTNLGHSVHIARSAEEAEEIFHKHMEEIDLLLTDIILPTSDGKELYDTLVALKPDLKGLFMSGHTLDYVKDKGMLEPGLTFIRKPFAQIEIDSIIRQVSGEAN